MEFFLPILQIGKVLQSYLRGDGCSLYGDLRMLRKFSFFYVEQGAFVEVFVVDLGNLICIRNGFRWSGSVSCDWDQLYGDHLDFDHYFWDHYYLWDQLNFGSVDFRISFKLSVE